MSEHQAWDAVEAVSASVDDLLAADLSGVDDVLSVAEVVEEAARKVAMAQQRLAAEVVARESAEAGGRVRSSCCRRGCGCLRVRRSPGSSGLRILRLGGR